MRTVLLIEPDYILAETYKRALESSGLYTVNTVRGAQSGIMSADESCPELVLLELQLIEHSGVEFLYEFRSYPEWQSIPVIIHSVVPFAEFQDSWHLLQGELGVSSYLYKANTSLSKLLTVVEEHSLIST